MAAIFKITESIDGFSVWRRKSFGNGFAYEPEVTFKDRESAEEYIEKQRAGEEK